MTNYSYINYFENNKTFEEFSEKGTDNDYLLCNKAQWLLKHIQSSAGPNTMIPLRQNVAKLGKDQLYEDWKKVASVIKTLNQELTIDYKEFMDKIGSKSGLKCKCYYSANVGADDKWGMSEFNSTPNKNLDALLKESEKMEPGNGGILLGTRIANSYLKYLFDAPDEPIGIIDKRYSLYDGLNKSCSLTKAALDEMNNKRNQGLGQVNEMPHYFEVLGRLNYLYNAVCDPSGKTSMGQDATCPTPTEIFTESLKTEGELETESPVIRTSPPTTVPATTVPPTTTKPTLKPTLKPATQEQKDDVKRLFDIATRTLEQTRDGLTGAALETWKRYDIFQKTLKKIYEQPDIWNSTTGDPALRRNGIVLKAAVELFMGDLENSRKVKDEALYYKLMFLRKQLYDTFKRITPTFYAPPSPFGKPAQSGMYLPVEKIRELEEKVNPQYTMPANLLSVSEGEATDVPVEVTIPPTTMPATTISTTAVPATRGQDILGGPITGLKSIEDDMEPEEQIYIYKHNIDIMQKVLDDNGFTSSGPDTPSKLAYVSLILASINYDKMLSPRKLSGLWGKLRFTQTKSIRDLINYADNEIEKVTDKEKYSLLLALRNTIVKGYFQMFEFQGSVAEFPIILEFPKFKGTESVDATVAATLAATTLPPTTLAGATLAATTLAATTKAPSGSGVPPEIVAILVRLVPPEIAEILLRLLG